MSPLRRRALVTAPVALAALGGSALWVRLEHLSNPSFPPNPLLGRGLPDFAVPGLPPGPGFTNRDIVQPVLLNFFASWCIPCVQESPVLLRLHKQGVPIWGIAYRDKPDATAGFLHRNGDPYERVGMDPEGSAGQAFGLLGVPETWLVDARGMLRWHWTGGLSEDIVRSSLEPALREVA
jgi:cytochrome c biogenesis protein CcmG/thiol:disulfide interchange protein DsbE